MRKSIIFGGIIASALSAVLLWHSLRPETIETELPDRPYTSSVESNSTKADGQTKIQSLAELVKTLPQEEEATDSEDEPKIKKGVFSDLEEGVSGSWEKKTYSDGSWEITTITDYSKRGIKEKKIESGHENDVVSSVIEKYDLKENCLLGKEELGFVDGEKTASTVNYDKKGG